jgi:hypothetical protein
VAAPDTRYGITHVSNRCHLLLSSSLAREWTRSSVVTSTRWLVLVLLVASLALLVPGLFLPVLTIRGVLTRQGIAQMAPTLLERGLDDGTVAALRGMMNPTVVGLLDLTGGDLRQTIIDRVTPALTASLQKNVGEVEVFQQTRSIAGSVRRLYEVGSPIPATLILLFSVVVPFGKTALVGWAMFAADGERRRRILAFVETIAKWSMADVFVVALFITYLVAIATQSTPGGVGPGSGVPVVAFTARFGPGFYWFAAYCLFSLASQQLTARILAPRDGASLDPRAPHFR